MGIETVQTDKNHLNFVNDADAVADFKIGGPGTGQVSNPRYYGRSRAKIQMTAGVDTGGGVTSWQNPFNYGIIVSDCILDVTTASTGTCTLEVGSTSANATTVSTNLIASQSVAATGTFNSGFKSVKVAAGSWLTVSTASGTSTGLVGYTYFDFTPV